MKAVGEDNGDRAKNHWCRSAPRAPNQNRRRLDAKRCVSAMTDTLSAGNGSMGIYWCKLKTRNSGRQRNTRKYVVSNRAPCNPMVLVVRGTGACPSPTSPIERCGLATDTLCRMFWSICVSDAHDENRSPHELIKNCRHKIVVSSAIARFMYL